jgi:hypothetical protein
MSTLYSSMMSTLYSSMNDWQVDNIPPPPERKSNTVFEDDEKSKVTVRIVLTLYCAVFYSFLF